MEYLLVSIRASQSIYAILWRIRFACEPYMNTRAAHQSRLNRSRSALGDDTSQQPEGGKVVAPANCQNDNKEL